MQSILQQRNCLLLSLLVIFTGCNFDGCTTDRFPPPFYISNNPVFEVVKGPGQFILDATCPTGQQLLGGGYYMPDGDNMLQIGVTASYPLNTDTWRVIFENPDNGRANLIEGYILSATAYCLATDDYPINSIIISEITQNQSSTSPFSIEAACPTNTVLTGGGFQTGISSPSFSLFNSNLFVSAPTMDSNGQANGWQVALSYLPQDIIPETTVYALCAQENLIAGPLVVESLDLTTLPTAWGWSEVSATCPDNMFTTGGGYSIIGDLLIPRQVSTSNVQSQYSTWRNIAAFGYQTPNYDFRPCDPSINPNCAQTAALAACIEIPDIPFVQVKIIQPDDAQSFPPQGGSSETAPITFVAEATDESGEPLTGGSLQWFRDDMPIGTGDTITTTLPAPQGSVISFQIKVTATGESTSASDQITVFTGIIH
jgi:hypothetical protein